MTTIIRNLFDCAGAWGHRAEAAGNPCRGIVRYRRPPRGRLLGAGDRAKLGAVLRRRENDRPACAVAEEEHPRNSHCSVCILTINT